MPSDSVLITAPETSMREPLFSILGRWSNGRTRFISISVPTGNGWSVRRKAAEAQMSLVTTSKVRGFYYYHAEIHAGSSRENRSIFRFSSQFNVAVPYYRL